MATINLTNLNTFDLSLRDLAAPVFRRKYLVLFTFVGVLAVLLVLGVTATSKFTSQMSVLVERERLDPLISTGSPTNEVRMASTAVTLDEINSEAELLKSEDLLRDVVLQTGLAQVPPGSFIGASSSDQNQATMIAKAVRKLARALQIHNDSNSDLIQVSYSSPDPTQSYRVLKTLGDLYIQKHMSVHRPPGSFAFFDQETSRYKKALDDSELRLKEFSRTQDVAAPDTVRSNLSVQLANFIGQLHIDEQMEAADRRRIETDEVQMSKTPERSATQQASSPADKLLNDLKVTLLAAEAKQAQLKLKYDMSYPLVQEADEEIAEAKAAVQEAEQIHYVIQTTDRDPTFELLREDLAKTRTDLAALEAGLAATRDSIRAIQGQMVDLEQKSLTQQDLLRDRKVNEDDYLNYLSKREEARTTDALDNTRISNVAIAVPPSIPVLPAYSFPLIALMAVGIAGAASLCVAYVVDYCDPSFHTPAQVIERLGIPIVIAMPRKAA